MLHSTPFLRALVKMGAFAMSPFNTDKHILEYGTTFRCFIFTHISSFFKSIYWCGCSFLLCNKSFFTPKKGEMIHMMYTSFLKRDLSCCDALNAMMIRCKGHSCNIWEGYWFLARKTQADSSTTRYEINPIIFAVLKNNAEIVPAQPYQGEMLVNDWMVVE